MGFSRDITMNNAVRTPPSDVRSRFAVAALTTALLIGAGGTPAAGADSPWLYGIHWYGPTATTDVETMTGGKGIWTLEIVLPQGDPWMQAWYLHPQLQTIVARGHTVICRIECNWGQAIPLPGADYAARLQAYLADVQGTAAYLADVVHVWQIANEMNILEEWGGNALPPATYVDAYRQIRAAIHAVPSPLGAQIVLVGPVSPGGVEGSRHTAGDDYLGQMCAALAPDDVDGFALHAYGLPYSAAPIARNTLQKTYKSQLGILDAKGFAYKPVYLTEWNRRVDPPEATNEPQSAQFLHGGLLDLHNWNQTAGAHPIAAACWFIYQYDDAAWPGYSIAYLRTLGPAGANNDLYDALQYAATQNYPAGYPFRDPAAAMYTAVPGGINVAPQATATASSSYGAANTAAKATDGIIATGNRWTSGIGVAPPHELVLDLGAPQPISGYTVHHAGAAGGTATQNTRTFEIQAADDAAGPWQTEALVENAADANVTVRRYVATRRWRWVRLLITDPGSDSFARIAECQVWRAPDGDVDNSGATDLADLAVLAACVSGPGQTVAPEACPPYAFGVLDLDADGDVDLADFAGFQRALSGA